MFFTLTWNTSLAVRTAKFACKYLLFIYILPYLNNYLSDRNRQAKLLLIYLVHFFFLSLRLKRFSVYEQYVLFTRFLMRISALLIINNSITCVYNVNVDGRLMSRMFFVFRHIHRTWTVLKLTVTFSPFRQQ